MRSDLSLIYAARFGDGRAFAQLVDRYANILFRFALRFVSSAQAAEELAHDTLVDLYRNLDRYEPRAALGTYLCAILSKKALYSRRKQAHAPAALEGDHAPAKSSGALEKLLRDEELQGVKRRVDGLDPPLRLVVEMHYMEGMKLREIAGAMGIPVGTVKSRLNAALKVLRKGLPKGDQR